MATDSDAWSALLEACNKEEPIAPKVSGSGIPPPLPHPRALSGGPGAGIPGKRQQINPPRMRRASSGSESDVSLLSLEEQIPRLGFTVIFMPNGDKGYRCPEPGCMKVCSRLPDCKKHQRTHGDERPFPCRKPNCKKRFKDTSTRCKHERTHEIHAFPCPFCKRTYTRKDNLAAHKKQKHPGMVLGESGDDIQEIEERPHERPRPSASSASSDSPPPLSPSSYGSGASSPRADLLVAAATVKAPGLGSALQTSASANVAAVAVSASAGGDAESDEAPMPTRAAKAPSLPAVKVSLQVEYVGSKPARVKSEATNGAFQRLSNFIGVTACAQGFRAHLFSNGFKNDLGLFATELEAAAAHDSAARKIPGKRLNFSEAVATTPTPLPLVAMTSV